MATDNLNNSFQVWQKYADAYTNSMIEATQRTLAQSLAVREQLDQIFIESAKKAQALTAAEQEAAIAAFESAQQQSQTTVEQFGKLFQLPTRR